MATRANLPPDPLPPLADPCFGDQPGPYSASPLRDVCGTRIQPDALGFYKHRELLCRADTWVKTCAHPELEAWLGDVGGFDPRSALSQPALSEWPLSAIIPRLSVWGEQLPFPLDPATYVIDYTYLHSNPRTLPERAWVMRLRERFPEGAKLILAFFGNRALTLGLWPQIEFWHHPFLDQFDAVLMPDFSAFSDDPTPQYLLGERMQQVFAQDGARAGRTVIPSIAWTTESSLRRQIELWASRYPSVNTIHLDCYGSQVDRTGWNWRWLFAMEKYCAHLPHIRWLVSGMTSGWTVRELNRIFPAGNYCLAPSVSAYLGVMSGSRDPAWQAQAFRIKMRRFEDLKAGREVAEPMARPDSWPTFSDVAKTRG